MNMTEKRKSYDLKFKQSVIKYAEENSNREAGGKFSIKPFKTIFRELYTKGGVVKPSNYVCKFSGLSMLGRKLVRKLSRNHSKHVTLQRVASTKTTV